MPRPIRPGHCRHLPQRAYSRAARAAQVTQIAVKNSPLFRGPGVTFLSRPVASGESAWPMPFRRVANREEEPALTIIEVRSGPGHDSPLQALCLQLGRKIEEQGG